MKSSGMKFSIFLTVILFGCMVSTYSVEKQKIIYSEEPVTGVLSKKIVLLQSLFNIFTRNKRSLAGRLCANFEGSSLPRTDGPSITDDLGLGVANMDCVPLDEKYQEQILNPINALEKFKSQILEENNSTLVHKKIKEKIMPNMDGSSEKSKEQNQNDNAEMKLKNSKDRSSELPITTEFDSVNELLNYDNVTISNSAELSGEEESTIQKEALFTSTATPKLFKAFKPKKTETFYKSDKKEKATSEVTRLKEIQTTHSRGTTDLVVTEIYNSYEDEDNSTDITLRMAHAPQSVRVKDSEERLAKFLTENSHFSSRMASWAAGFFGTFTLIAILAVYIKLRKQRRHNGKNYKLHKTQEEYKHGIELKEI